MSIKKAIQIGDNVTDVIRLPCVVACIKKDDQQGFEWLEYRVKCGVSGRAQYAEKGDWLVEDTNGYWHIMTDDEYKKRKTTEDSRPPQRVGTN